MANCVPVQEHASINSPRLEQDMRQFRHWLTTLCKPAQGGRVRRHGAATDLPATLPSEDDAPPKGCGWFDSSHELMRGLVMQELH